MVRLRRISPLTVDGLRPSSTAMALTGAFSRILSAMQIRSSWLRHRDEEEADGGTTGRTGDAALFPAGRSASVAPAPADLRVHPDDSARALVAHTLLRELEVCSSLSRELVAALRAPYLPNLEVHRIP